MKRGDLMQDLIDMRCQSSNLGAPLGRAKPVEQKLSVDALTVTPSVQTGEYKIMRKIHVFRSFVNLLKRS
jgi:hypothetical protein